MERTVLVDSTIYIQLLRRGIDPSTALPEQMETLNLVTCGMVQIEVLRGVRNPNIKRKLEEFMSVMIFVTTDNLLWAEAAELAWQLDRQGRVLPATDVLIAACALRSGAEVLTHDKHFEDIPHLPLAKVPDPWR